VRLKTCYMLLCALLCLRLVQVGVLLLLLCLALLCALAPLARRTPSEHGVMPVGARPLRLAQMRLLLGARVCVVFLLLAREWTRCAVCQWVLGVTLCALCLCVLGVTLMPRLRLTLVIEQRLLPMLCPRLLCVRRLGLHQVLPLRGPGKPGSPAVPICLSCL
jgi:hypothetical protein